MIAAAHQLVVTAVHRHVTLCKSWLNHAENAGSEEFRTALDALSPISPLPKEHPWETAERLKAEKKPEQAREVIRAYDTHLLAYDIGILLSQGLPEGLPRPHDASGDRTPEQLLEYECLALAKQAPAIKAILDQLSK